LFNYSIFRDLFCPGWQFYKCKLSEKYFDELSRNILQNSNDHKNSNSSDIVNELHINSSTAPVQTKALLRAFDAWISSERCFQTGLPLGSYGDLPMDYLIQLIISGNQVIFFFNYFFIF
jgi:hypothetical protein